MSFETIRHLRARLGLDLTDAAHVLGVDPDTLERWEADPDARDDATQAPPWAVLALRALVSGWTPPPVPDDWPGGTMTASQARALLRQLRLRQNRFAVILGTNDSTVRKWLAHDGASTRRRMNPVAARLLWWMAHGWRPPGGL